MSQAEARIENTVHARSTTEPTPPARADRGRGVVSGNGARGGGGKRMSRYLRPSTIIGTGIKGAANLAWHAFQAVNKRVPYRSFQPKWSRG